MNSKLGYHIMHTQPMSQSLLRKFSMKRNLGTGVTIQDIRFKYNKERHESNFQYDL